jgi:hypothetical protein
VITRDWGKGKRKLLSMSIEFQFETRIER